jgi:uncharacterized membrane protein YjjP (DUF1212 family)
VSDIAIRFDGLLLAGSLAVAALIFMVAAAAMALGRLAAPQHAHRLSAAARSAALFALLNLAALGLVAAYIAQRSSPAGGRDWLDWLTVPAVMLFVAGCVLTARRRSAPAARPVM